MSEERTFQFNPPKTRRIDGPLILAIALCFAIAAPIIHIVYTAFDYHLDFRQFMSSLSNSTVYAYQNDCLRAELAVDVVRVNGEHTYSLFALFTEQKSKPRREAPDTSPDLVLDYGDGAILECWNYRLEESAKRWYGVFWRFTDSNGEIWMYDTDSFGMQDVQRLVALAKNEPW